MNENKRVILITGDKQKWYEQAIFIVRKEYLNKKIPKDFVYEAECIINNYLSNSIPVAATIETALPPKASKTIVAKKSKKSLDIILNVMMFACCIVLAVLIYIAYFK